jgi:hypothetical protein
VGTNQPTQALDVNGSLRVRGLSNPLGTSLPVVRPDGTLGLSAPAYYTTARSGQLQLIDTASTGNQFPTCVAVDGNTVYVGVQRLNTTPALLVYDVSVPGAMRRVTTISLPDVPFRIALAPGRLYLLGRLKLLTYTVDATGTLSLASDYPLPVNSFNPLGSSPNKPGLFSAWGDKPQPGRARQPAAGRGN